MKTNCKHDFVRFEGDKETIDGKIPVYTCIPPLHKRNTASWCGEVFKPYGYAGLKPEIPMLDIAGSYKTFCYAVDERKGKMYTYYHREPHESMSPMRAPI